MDGYDSNAYILPARKVIKKKLTDNKKKVFSHPQLKKCESARSSKSQKKKLMKDKSTEEKEKKDQLLLNSLKTLQKYMINEDVSSLLQSSESIGQAETKLAKRRRDMQLSKAGLKALQIDQYSNEVSLHGREADAQESCELELSDQNFTLQDVAIVRAAQIDRGGPDANNVVEEEVADEGTSNVAEAGVDSESHPNDLTEEEVADEDTSEQFDAGVESESSADCGGSYPNYLIDENVMEDIRYEMKAEAVSDFSGHHRGLNHDDLVVEVANEDTCNGMQPDTENSPSCQISNDVRTETSEEKQDGSSGIDCAKVEQGSASQPIPTVIPVTRPEEVETSRQKLPIIMMEQEIIEAISEHNNVIICGDTGCGKTTQVPQFLYEAGYGSKFCSMKSGVIGMTQPRRVAVLSTAQRVAKELGARLGDEVGYQVRHDKKVGENCAIKFMTDGILLQELKSDFILKRYSVIIVDEAHERSMNTDLLIALLSRVNNARQIMSGDQHQPMPPLKLVLMSATLRVEDFTLGNGIFLDPYRIDISARQHPIRIQHSKETELVNYIDKAYKMVLKIHKNMPPGGILVFVTGQREVEVLRKKLVMASEQLMKRDKSEVYTEHETAKKADKYQFHACVSSSEEQQTDSVSWHCEDSDSDDSCSSENLGTFSEFYIGSDGKDIAEQKISGVDGICSKPPVNLDLLKAAFEGLEKSGPRNTDGEKEINPMTPDDCSDKSCRSLIMENRGVKGSKVGAMCILPLYAMLPAADQLRVFKEVKEGVRKVVVATNVAETSLTIPGITYVVDTGREKVKRYNPSDGTVSYDIQWISQASADQRAGRAGRTGPGQCKRLYSSAALNNEFPKFSFPEISKVPVDGVVLLLKSIGLKKVENFPFPTPPDASAFLEADLCLKTLGALDDKSNLTTLGRIMARYPISPRASKFLLVAIQITKKQIGCVRPYLVLAYAVAAAAALDLPNTSSFQFEGCQTYNEDMEQDGVSGSFGSHRKANQAKKLKNFSNLRSDTLTAAYGLHCFEHSKDKARFCKDNGLQPHTMKEMHKLRKQLLKLVYEQRCCSLDEEFTWTLGPDKEDDWMTVPSDKYPLSQTEEDILCEAICAGWADRVAKRSRVTKQDERDSSTRSVPYQASTMAKKTKVFLGRWSSVNKSAPEFLVFTEMLDTKKRYIIHGATRVEPRWLVKYAGSLCTYSELSEDHKPVYDAHSDQMLCYIAPYFGRHRWELPLVRVPIKDVEQRVAAFAFALLEGDVLPCLKSVKKYLSASPSSVLRHEARAHRRVGFLLRNLMCGPRTIDSCRMLQEAWKDNPLLLHSEIQDWFQVGFRSFEVLWENMLSEALLAPPERFSDRTKKRKRAPGLLDT